MPLLWLWLHETIKQCGDLSFLCVCHCILFPQVSGVLELLVGDVCQQFYYDALGLEQISSKRKALRVMFLKYVILLYLLITVYLSCSHVVMLFNY